VLWGKRAEGSLKDYLKKGQQVFVSGELTQSEYQGKDGTTKTILEVNASILDLVGKRSDAPQQQAEQKPQEKYKTPAQEYEELERQKAARSAPAYDDDIPF
jgi:single-strand DNA-binding protein